MEVFGKFGEISLQAYKQGFFDMQPYDFSYDCDLKDPEQVASLEHCMARRNPRPIVIEFLCRVWSPLQGLTAGNPRARRKELRRRQISETPFLQLTERLFLTQPEKSDDALAENPWISRARAEPEIQRLGQRGDCYVATRHQCRFNERHLFSG